MKVWVTSDEHYGHDAIIKLAGRPFTSLEHMERTIVTNFNRLVSDVDVTYHLGDFCFGSFTKIHSTLSKLNGTHILIRGNHDKHTNHIYYRAGFSAVLTEAYIKHGKQKVLLSHYPYKIYWLYHWYNVNVKKYRHNDRHKRPTDAGLALLHGHTHSLEKRNGRQINVCVDCRNYSPVLLSNIL